MWASPWRPGLAAWVNGMALAVILYRRGHFAPDARLRSRLPRIVAASAVMAGAVWAANRWIIPALPLEALGEGLPGIGALVVLMAIGGGSFVVAAFALGATSLTDIKGMIRPREAQATEK